VTVTLPDYIVSNEEGGGIMTINVLGHHDDETALAVAREALIEWDGEVPKLGFDKPVRTFLRQVPADDGDGGRWMAHHYFARGGRGARAVTRVDLARYWPYRCWACGARAQTGFDPGGAHYLETEGFLPPQPDPDPSSRASVWLCRAHARIVEEHRSAIWSVCNVPCPDCGHALGQHERYEHGAQYPCGFGYKEACACAHPSPHTAVITLDDLRAVERVP